MPHPAPAPADGSSALLLATLSGRTAWAWVDSPTGYELLFHAHQPFPTLTVELRENDDVRLEVLQSPSGLDWKPEDQPSLGWSNSLGTESQTNRPQWHFGTDCVRLHWSSLANLAASSSSSRRPARRGRRGEAQEVGTPDRRLQQEQTGPSSLCRPTADICSPASLPTPLPLAASVTLCPRRQPQRQYLCYTWWERRRGRHLKRKNSIEQQSQGQV